MGFHQDRTGPTRWVGVNDGTAADVATSQPQ